MSGHCFANETGLHFSKIMLVLRWTFSERVIFICCHGQKICWTVTQLNICGISLVDAYVNANNNNKLYNSLLQRFVRSGPVSLDVYSTTYAGHCFIGCKQSLQIMEDTLGTNIRQTVVFK